MSTTIFLLIAAPGQVGNLRVLFNSTGSSFDRVTRMYTLVIEIAWDVPVNLNGVITSYEVTVTQTDNSSVIVYTDDSLTVTSVTQSVEVLPFTNYTVTVTASTSAGQGDPESVVELSPEAGKQTESNLYPCVATYSFVSPNVHVHTAAFLLQLCLL